MPSTITLIHPFLSIEKGLSCRRFRIDVLMDSFKLFGLRSHVILLEISFGGWLCDLPVDQTVAHPTTTTLDQQEIAIAVRRDRSETLGGQND